MELTDRLKQVLKRALVFDNPTRRFLIEELVRRRAAIVSANGALAAEFSTHFDEPYGNEGIDPVVAAQCPGR